MTFALAPLKLSTSPSATASPRPPTTMATPTPPHAASPARVAHAHARVVPSKDDRGGLNAVRAQRGADPPVEEDARHGVGPVCARDRIRTSE